MNRREFISKAASVAAIIPVVAGLPVEASEPEQPELYEVPKYKFLDSEYQNRLNRYLAWHGLSIKMIKIDENQALATLHLQFDTPKRPKTNQEMIQEAKSVWGNLS